MVGGMEAKIKFVIYLIVSVEEGCDYERNAGMEIE